MGQELSELGKAALDYARRGWSVFPLLEREKKPAITNGLLGATTDPEQIEIWWAAHPNDNVAIALGSAARNIVAIDIDYDEEKGEDGWATLSEWEREHGKLPETVTDLSGRGGGRLYYIVDRPVHNTTNATIGMDIRGEGGYVVAPPSIHPNGRQYCWENDPDEYEVAEADENVYALIERINGGPLGRRKKFELPKNDIASGGRNETLFKYACQMQERGDGDDLILATIEGINAVRCKPPLSSHEVEKIVSQALAYSKGEKTMAVATGIASEKLKHINEIAGYIEREIGQSIGISMPCRRQYVRGPLPWDDSGIVRPWSDYDFASLLAMLEPCGVNDKKLAQAVTIAMHHSEFWPVRDMLDFLPKWDGKTRPIDVFSKLIGVDPSIEYNVYATSLFMSGAVARAYQPGIKFDYTVILIGPSGIGKSSFTRKIAMDDCLFTDALQNLSDPKLTEESMQGKWIGELPELTGMSGKSVEAIKAILTRTSWDARPPYGRYTETYQRGYVFIGTSNGSGVPNDPSGALARRLLPIKCCEVEHIDVADWDDAGADELIRQAWAGVVETYKANNGNIMLTLPNWLQHEATERRSDATEEDIDKARVLEFLETVRSKSEFDGVPARVNTMMVCKLCLGWSDEFISRSRKETAHVAEVLDNAPGWRRCRGKQRVTFDGQSFGIARTWEVA